MSTMLTSSNIKKIINSKLSCTVLEGNGLEGSRLAPPPTKKITKISLVLKNLLELNSLGQQANFGNLKFIFKFMVIMTIKDFKHHYMTLINIEAHPGYQLVYAGRYGLMHHDQKNYSYRRGNQVDGQHDAILVIQQRLL